MQFYHSVKTFSSLNEGGRSGVARQLTNMSIKVYVSESLAQTKVNKERKRIVYKEN